MDDISEKLAGILNDPESMERVRRMAEGLLSSEQAEEKPSALTLGEGMPTADEMQKLMHILGMLKEGGGDSRTKLLLALKDNLSPPKKEKVDTAVKILRIIDILPMLKESGILNF